MLNQSQKIMGILNCTPDSFYDGGHYKDVDALIWRALMMEQEGASFIDIGGESTRPEALPVSLKKELERVIPVIKGIRKKSKISISIDTTKALVARAAIEAGANMINDVSGLTADPDMLFTVRDTKVPVVIMHSRGNPQTMQTLTQYENVLEDVYRELHEHVQKALAGGILSSQIIIDPGFGFSKTPEQNVILLRRLKRFLDMGYPILVGLSRKSFIGWMLGEEKTENRLYGSLAAHLYAGLQGASFIRTHDVKQTREALQVMLTLKE